MYQKGLTFINSKYGIALSTMCALFLLAIGVYSLVENLETERTFKTVCSVLTIGMGISGLYGAFVRARKLQRSAENNL